MLSVEYVRDISVAACFWRPTAAAQRTRARRRVPCRDADIQPVPSDPAHESRVTYAPSGIQLSTGGR